MDIIEASASETGSVAEHVIYNSNVNHSIHHIMFSVNIFDPATVATLQPTFRWTDPGGIARSYSPLPPFSVATAVYWSTSFPVWLGLDQDLTFELAAAITLGTLNYCYIVTDEARLTYL